MAKGGKGRKGGGGGGGKTRKYSRDSNGRFASTGTGATARGGRLLTPKGNKRKTKTMEAGGAKAAGTIKGKVKRDPAAASKVAQRKAAAPSTKAKSPKFVTEQSGRVRRAALGGGRTAIVRANSATIINAKGEPIMTRKGLPNITAGKKWAANPNARGPRLMRNKFASEAAPSRDFARTSRSAGTTRKPRGTARAAAGTIKGKVKRDPAAASKVAQRKAAAKPTTVKATKAPKSQMRATKRAPFAPNSAAANRLAMFKSDKQLTDQRTKSLKAGLKKETNPLQKIQTGSSISSLQLKSKSYGDQITRMQARPIMGKRAGGRGDKPVLGPAAKRPNAIKGKPRRDASVAAKVKPGTNLNAKKYPAIYRDRANIKGKAAAKAAKRPMR